MTYRLPVTRRSRAIGKIKRTSLGSLGDDDISMQRHQETITELKRISEWQQRWVERDELQRWIQIGVTASIPLFGAIWRVIFGRRV